MADDANSLADDLARLRAARASGASEVEFSSASGVSRRVRYKTDAELQSAIDDVQRRLDLAAGSRPVRGIVVRNAGGW